MKKKVQVVIIHKSTKQVLLLKTNSKSGGFWQNVTGSVENDESYLEAAKRELKEETTLDGEFIELPTEYKFKCRWTSQDTNEKSYLAIVKVKDLKLSHEHEEHKWLNINDVSQSSYEFESNYNAFIEAKDLI